MVSFVIMKLGGSWCKVVWIGVMKINVGFFLDKNRHHNRCSRGKGLMNNVTRSARASGQCKCTGCQWNRVGGDSSCFALELRGSGAGGGSGTGFARAKKPSRGVAGRGHVWGIPTCRRPNLGCVFGASQKKQPSQVRSGAWLRRVAGGNGLETQCAAGKATRHKGLTDR